MTKNEVLKMKLEAFRQTFQDKTIVYFAGVRGTASAFEEASAIFDPDSPDGFEHETTSMARYGGGNTAHFIVNFGKRPDQVSFIIIDAGSGLRGGVKNLIMPVIRYAIEFGIKEIRVTWVLTHYHEDHVNGITGANPLLFFFHEGVNVKIKFKSPKLGGCGEKPQMQTIMEETYDGGGNFPVPLSSLTAEMHHSQFNVGDTITVADDFKIRTLHGNHPEGVCHYRFEQEGRKAFVMMTDTDLGPEPREEVLEFCRGAKSLYIDSQYRDEEYYGKEPTNDSEQPMRRGGEGVKSWGHSCPYHIVLHLKEMGIKGMPEVTYFGHHGPADSDQFLDRKRREVRLVAAEHGVPPVKIKFARGGGLTRFTL